jgi:LysM repeat protein
VVYLQSKKKQAAKGLEKHVIEEGESLRDISQKYAVRLSRIYKINGFDETYVPKEGDIIKLRK